MTIENLALPLQHVHLFLSNTKYRVSSQGYECDLIQEKWPQLDNQTPLYSSFRLQV